ncbi:OmpA family protein [Hymenobacter chitinivorans]|uniref:Outer membrane protein OmpA-like peptidoglycan-associated protein n=1 Tax=Hymenobacter chitinivorans DSM 11115 TaxID=1121954 RepID=A0A2M9BAF8_9BACT|nr:OmpA family protein [Hymenobacter chitinivorans]PJJ54926.1 outer membrane protein OmpA-like peptidoglycan-associated protein [Hymenobacter chitinivorans DSM 11115]
MKHLLLRFQFVVTALGLAALVAPPAQAQTSERRTGLGLVANGLQYQGDFGSDYWKLDNTQLAPGLVINQYLGKGLDLSTQVLYGELTGRRSENTHFKTTLINVNLGFKLKLNNGWALKENSLIQPYLLAAPGWTYASRTGQFGGARIDLDKGYVDLFAAAGISLRLGAGVSVFVQSGQHLPMYANLDGTVEAGTPRWADRFLQHSVGLTFNLGQALDMDEDGVSDRLDKCANTPAGVLVDDNGCPLDGDADGVPDYLDACATEAGVAELRGCPDKDNDGVTDSEDNCPDIAGSIDRQGCPDADSDGIIDPDDKCPDTPAGATVDASGCPVADTTDSTAVAPAAPVPAPASTDTDGDGVLNAADRCPNSAGPASNGGCPEIRAEVRRSLQAATRSIRFETNKAVLLPSSYPTLDALVPVLSDYPDYSLSIAGHTDNKGPAAFNLALSRERAAAARRYLVEKGVAENRIEMRGYGPRYPIVSNATDAGRARNRRVEFDLFVSSGKNAAQAKYGAQPTSTPAKAGKARSVRKKALRKAPTTKTGTRKAVRPGTTVRKPVAPRAKR